jgi:hypothetical protein|tara:strand:+ start:305 stop:520 length:216 start_codon:yes stop_codon:yes gene_type:complete
MASMDIVEQMSYEESKKQKKERLEHGLNMIRPFTFDEKKILWDGLREEKTLSELLHEGFVEEQKQREQEDD